MESQRLVLAGLGALSTVVMAAPVQAATLQYWWFDAAANQLVFTTDSGVQPRAQMLFNPTRVVVDLPNTRLGSSNREQRVGDGIQTVRVGQFDQQTTRLVIELAAGYTLDPGAVRVQGMGRNQWVVQLPEATAGPGGNPGAASQPGNIATTATANTIASGNGTEAQAILNGVTTTGDGFLIKLSGSVPDPTVEVSGEGPDDRTAVITLPNTAVASSLRPEDLPNYRYSIISWDIAQQTTTPPSTQITLKLGPSSPDWRALRNSSGIILLPPRGVSISDVPDEPLPGNASAGATSSPPPTVPVQPQAQPAQLPPQPDTLPTVPQGRVVVVIDPGHGGRDPGAVGINGLQEKQVIFPISLRVAEILEEQGVTVVLTRSSDSTLDLQTRVDIAERARGTLFVSIHANAISMSRPDVNGVETYYASESGRRLAAAIQASMLAATGMNDRGVKQARFFVLRRTSMPAALAEVGFVTGAQDAPRLADPAWRETAANAIARGILQYIAQTY
jgi:N-acetylmuramoyl-L-alanine amidase